MPVAPASLLRRLLAAALLSCCARAGAIDWANPASIADQEAAEHARAVLRQALDITRGSDHSLATCARAMPLLLQAAQAWARLPDTVRNDAFVELERARCEIGAGQFSAAAARLQALLARPPMSRNTDLWSGARLALADLYEGGKGVPADPERALALYLLAMPQGAEEVRHRDRSAAE
ncbi:MAG: SEL1-like repeat protein, partial [Xenophilus sp.]